MSKQSSRPGKVDSDALPPIPDGGLSTGMPDWLRRPPAWRGLQESAAPAKVVPLPDTSPIDPRSILTVEDLPDWLQRIAAGRSDQPSDEVASGPGGEERSPQGREKPVAASPVMVPEARSDSSEETIGTSSPVGTRRTIDDPIPPTVTPLGPSGNHQWWLSGTLVVPLLVCLAIALLIIALYAVGVF